MFTHAHLTPRLHFCSPLSDFYGCCVLTCNIITVKPLNPFINPPPPLLLSGAALSEELVPGPWCPHTVSGLLSGPRGPVPKGPGGVFLRLLLGSEEPPPTGYLHTSHLCLYQTTWVYQIPAPPERIHSSAAPPLTQRVVLQAASRHPPHILIFSNGGQKRCCVVTCITFFLHPSRFHVAQKRLNLAL